MIYFLQLQDNGPIKIGTTSTESVLARVKLMVSTMPYEARLLAVMEGGEREEHDLHDRFIADNIRSEWFSPSPQLRSFISAIPEHPECDMFNGDEKRFVEFRFRLPRLMCSVLRDLAIDQGISTAAMVRELIKAGMERQFVPPSRPKPKGDEE